MKGASIIRECVVILIALSVVGCHCHFQEGQTMVASMDTLVSIAKEYIQRVHPRWLAETRELPPTVTDRGTYWEVSFVRPPPVGPGGVPFVHIDKKTLKVIKAYHTQ